MRRALPIAAAAAALAIGAWAPAAAPAHGLDTGVVLADGGTGDAPLTFSRVRAANATYVRLTVFWPSIAPATKPATWNPADPADPAYAGAWAPLDRAVRLAAAHGLKPVVTVTNSPPWAQAACHGDEHCSPHPSDYAHFATAIATRYSGAFDPGDGHGVLPRVRYWQAWVEPNLDFFFRPVFKHGKPVSPVIYRGILNAFSGAIHGVDPSNRVISAGLAPLARPGATIGPLDFMRRLLCMTGRAHPKPKPGCHGTARLDIWATHPYTTGGPTHKAAGPNDVSLGNLPEMDRMLRAAVRARHIKHVSPGVQFWATEFSWDSDPPDPGGLPERILTRWTAEALYRAWKAGISTLLWFSLRDQPKGASWAESYQSGLYLRGPTLAKDRPKRVLEAFRFPFVALRNKSGFHFWGRTPDGAAHAVRIEFKPLNRPYRRVRTLDAAANGIFEGNIRTGFKLGLARARISGLSTSVPFSLKYVGDFYQPPFG